MSDMPTAMDSSDVTPPESSLTLHWSQLEDDLSRVESDHAFELTIQTQDGAVVQRDGCRGQVRETHGLFAHLLRFSLCLSRACLSKSPFLAFKT